MPMLAASSLLRGGHIYFILRVKHACSQRDPSFRSVTWDDFVDRPKLDFVDAAKLILLVDVHGEEVTFAGRPGRMLIFAVIVNRASSL
jgi:hypothetical protein